MTANRKTLGFGCPNDIDPHHFLVTIPAGRTGAVTVTEHFGLLGGANGIPEREDRAVIPRGHWNKIADGVKRVFNERLKAKKLATSHWTPGANKVERLLGKELCVLAWGIEKVELDRVPMTLKNWSGFKPEERWWLFSMTAANAGTVEDSERGWRRALFHALTDGADELKAKRKRPMRTKEGIQTALPFAA
jgi:hypothetical protein